MKKILLLLLVVFSIILSSCGDKNNIKNNSRAANKNIEVKESLGGKVKNSSSSESSQDVLIDNADTSNTSIAPKKDLKSGTTTSMEGF